MFGIFGNVGHRNDLTGAVGFYLVFTIMLVGLSTFMGHYLGVLGLIDGSSIGSFFEGGGVHTLIGTGWVLMLSGLVLSKKGLTSDLFTVLIAIIGVYLAYTTSVMLGMVVVAYLTTLGKK